MISEAYQSSWIPEEEEGEPHINDLGLLDNFGGNQVGHPVHWGHHSSPHVSQHLQKKCDQVSNIDNKSIFFRNNIEV